MTEVVQDGNVIGMGTAFHNAVYNEWQAAEAIGASEEDVLDAISEVLEGAGSTQEDFESLEPLYLTRVVKVRQITWKDVDWV